MAGGNIAIFRTAANRVFALDDRCPHKGGPLSQGIVHGTSVACPLHNWQIALDTGEARAPDKGCTRRHPVKADAGRILISRLAMLTYAAAHERRRADPHDLCLLWRRLRRDWTPRRTARSRSRPIPSIPPIAAGSAPRAPALGETVGLEGGCSSR